MTSVRLAAARVLLALGDERGTLAAEVDRGRRALSDERDRGLLLELTSGVMRWRAELDAALAPCVSRPLHTLDAAVLAALRLAAYQLRHLDRIPPHAIVHESVELVRQLDQPKAAGFVNAALRTLQRRKDQPDVPTEPPAIAANDEWSNYLSVGLSHPQWLIDRWIERHGVQAAAAWCRFDNETPLVSIHALRVSDDEFQATASAAGVDATPSPFVQGAWRLAAGDFAKLPADLRDRVMIQDEASQIVGHIVDAEPDATVLDLCAAPGGKSIVMYGDMQARGVLISCDARSRRVRLLNTSLSKAGVPANIVCLDGTRVLPFPQEFDRVLVDAPCSGLGTLARDPDIRWRRQASDLKRYGATQLHLLEQAAAVVKRGGRLIYATCSGEPEETDEVVDAFIARHDAFRRVHRNALFERPVFRDSSSLLDRRGDLRTWPFAHQLDAFYASVLVRREGT